MATNARRVALHPAIDRALGLWASADAASADAATRSLGSLLRNFRQTPIHDPAWRASSLARNGFPVELGFTSADDSLRYTTEVAGVAAPAHARLAIAVTHLRQATGCTVPQDLVDHWTRVQQMGHLKYGAWISGRHRGQASRFKIYVEVPAAAASALERWETKTVGRAGDLAWRGARLTMIGWDGKCIELYYQAQSVRPGEVRVLLDRVGLAHRTNDLLDQLAMAQGRSIRRQLPATDLGWSYALDPTADEPLAGATFTLYAVANALFGGDGPIRAALLRLGSRTGWNLDRYRRLSQPLASRGGHRTQHGLFGLAVTSEREPAIAFGLAPPHFN